MVSKPSQFIDALGGAAVVAKRIGRRRNTVQVARTRERLPRDWWPDIQMNFPGVTLPTLLDVEAAGLEAIPPKSPRSSEDVGVLA